MKAISLWQPWSQLVVMGIKTLETRSWPCPPKIIGQRVAFHAAKRRPEVGAVGDWWPTYDPTWDLFDLVSKSGRVSLPLGAIVGSAVIADCLPIVECPDDIPDSPALIEYTPGLPGLTRPRLHLWPEGEDESGTDISDQLPYGDWWPGRYAWLIEDASPTTDRCPWCRGDGGDPESYESLVIGAPEVATKACPVCEGAGHCDPIPTKGRQGFWNWEAT